MRIYISVVLTCLLLLTSNLCHASDPEISSKEISLITVMSNISGRGGHSSLVIKSTETVIFDPAGRVRSKLLKEKADVLYNIDQNLENFYISIHARETHHVVKQTISVSNNIATKALKLAKANGPVAPALCARSISVLLGKLPGFELINMTYFPEKLMKNFSDIGGVKTKKIFENDGPDKHKSLIELEKKYEIKN